MASTNKTGPLNSSNTNLRIAPPASEKSTAKISTSESTANTESNNAEKTTKISPYSQIALAKISKVPDDIQLSPREANIANNTWAQFGATAVS